MAIFSSLTSPVMDSTPPPSSIFSQQDFVLSTGRFGDSAYLSNNVAILYDGIAELMSGCLIDSSLCLSNSASVSEHVVKRRTFDQAFASYSKGDFDSARTKFVEFANLQVACVSEKHYTSGPLTFLAEAGNDLFSRSIAAVFVESMKSDGLDLIIKSLPSLHYQRIESALSSLEELIPYSAASTLRLAPAVVVFSGNIDSAYINDNPCVSHINMNRFDDTLTLAEALIHEALHQKMVDIRLTGNILANGYDDLSSEDAGDVLVPWPNSSRPRKWSFARALAAYHVYIHLHVLYGKAYEKASGDQEYNDLDLSILSGRLITAFERARYLDVALSQPGARRNWGDDAEKFLSWLGARLVNTREYALLTGRLCDISSDWSSFIQSSSHRDQTLDLH